MDFLFFKSVQLNFTIGPKNMADKLQDYLTNLKMHDAKYQTTFIYSFTIRNF